MNENVSLLLVYVVEVALRRLVAHAFALGALLVRTELSAAVGADEAGVDGKAGRGAGRSGLRCPRIAGRPTTSAFSGDDIERLERDDRLRVAFEGDIHAILHRQYKRPVIQVVDRPTGRDVPRVDSFCRRHVRPIV